MEATQLNIFDVLRGYADKDSETYKAAIKKLTNFYKEPPPPSDGHIPLTLNEVKQPARSSVGIQIPNPPPKAISWLSRNWHWLVLCAIIIGFGINLYVQHRKRKKEQEFRRNEAERLAKINYPKPSEVSGPVIKVTAPSKSSSIEEFFGELEREEDAKKIAKPPASDSAPNDASPSNLEKK